jgi:hypothetical protein
VVTKAVSSEQPKLPELEPHPPELRLEVYVPQPAGLPPLKETKVAELFPMVPKPKSTPPIPSPGFVLPDVITVRVTLMPVPLFGVNDSVNTFPKQFDPPQPFASLMVMESA